MLINFSLNLIYKLSALLEATCYAKRSKTYIIRNFDADHTKYRAE